MKNLHRSLLAMAAIAAFTAPALADSQVQLFGIVDAGILSQSKSRTGGSQTRVETSGLRQSVWGLKGSEDLGSGLKAFFNLESHFDMDTGALHGSGDTAGSGTIIFRRQANLGLSGDWGSVTIGRQYGPALLAHLGTEPRAFKEQFSNLYAWAYNQLEPLAGSTAVNTNNDVGIFFKNAIQYRNTLGPVTFGVLYSLGEQAGNTSKNTAYAVGAAYNGPVVLSASFQAMKDLTTGNRNIEHAGLGGAVPFGAFTFKINWLQGKNSNSDGLPTSKVDAYSGGVDWKWSQANTATLAYYDNKDKRNSEDHTRNLVLSNDYALSKRTTLYAQAAFVDARSQASLKTSIVADGSFAPGQKTTFLNVGINHTF